MLPTVSLEELWDVEVTVGLLGGGGLCVVRVGWSEVDEVFSVVTSGIFVVRVGVSKLGVVRRGWGKLVEAASVVVPVLGVTDVRPSESPLVGIV